MRSKKWILISKLAFVLLVQIVPFCAKASSFFESYIDYLTILHGDAVEILATPQYCGDPHKDLLDISDEIKWRVDGIGSCRVMYEPDIFGNFSPLSHGGEISQFFFDEKKYQKILNSLVEMDRKFDVDLPLLVRMDLQMSMWEFISSLEWRRKLKVDWQPDIDEKKLNTLLQPAYLLLKKTLFSQDDFKKLALFKNHKVEELRKSIIAGCFFEIGDPTRVHESMSQGRLLSRVFFGADSNLGCKELKEAKDRKNSRISWSLAPEKIHDFHSIMILYYNILDTNFNVVSTDLVFGWREIKYVDLMDQKFPFDKKYRQVDFEYVERKKSSGISESSELLYAHADSEKFVRMSLIDVNPVYGAKLGSKGSTLKANCYSCHSSRVKSVDYRSTEVANAVVFFAPFERPVSDGRNEKYFAHIKNKFLSEQELFR